MQEAARRLDERVTRTPVFRSRTLDMLTGAEILLKAENLQHTGSFKYRGALNVLLSLPSEELAYGVGCASSGNHAQALACAAREVGCRAFAVMHKDAAVKRAAAEAYGASVRPYAEIAERDAVLMAWAEEEGFRVVPSSNHPLIVAGQSTVVWELLEQAGPLDALLVPVAGGGLLAGSALTLDVRGAPTRLVGAEVDRACSVADALRAGPSAIPVAVCAGLSRPAVADCITVTDMQIRSATTFLLERMKLVVEPGGAAALAAAMAGIEPPLVGRVGVVLTGGNIDRGLLSGWLRLGWDGSPSPARSARA
ncbi:MAG: threonine ammonia-lyase [Acidimicrobiales bacterium]